MSERGATSVSVRVKCATCDPSGRGRYCARHRCYCGHRECWAFDSWVDLTQISPDRVLAAHESGFQGSRVGLGGLDAPSAFQGRTVTSAQAARKILPRTGTQRRMVLEAIVDAYTRGHGGATDPELQRHLQLHANSERPRRVELVELGLISDSGKTRKHLGNAHTVWKPSSGALAALGWRPGEPWKPSYTPPPRRDDDAPQERENRYQ